MHGSRTISEATANDGGIMLEFAEEFKCNARNQRTKTESERFCRTLRYLFGNRSFNADGKALTSRNHHIFLGQNFAKAFDVNFAQKKEQQELCGAYFMGSFNTIDGGFSHEPIAD